jgi:hypothetical protein
MKDHPSPLASAATHEDDLAALAALYPAWSLRQSPFGFSAEHTSASGRQFRYLGGRTVTELAARLTTAEVVEP